MGRLFGTLVLLVALAIAGSCARRSTPPSVRPITLSKQTTVATAPLRADGYVDYAAALNERNGQGVTPENNAAVLLWEAVGPKAIDPTDRLQFFKMLGIAPLPEKADYFRVLDYVDLQETAREDRARNRGWTKDEFPVIYRWLSENQKPLDLIIDATKRPRLYEPIIPGANGEIGLAVLGPTTKNAQHVAEALATRAMLRLGDGNLDKSWEDLMAIHRLARLTGSGEATIAGALFAISVDGFANRGDAALLRSGRLSSADALRMRHALVSLGPTVDLAQAVDVGDRLFMCDEVASLVRRTLNPISTAGASSANSPSPIEKWLNEGGAEAVDWDQILRYFNSWYDRIVATMALPPRQRRSGMAQLERNFKFIPKESKEAIETMRQAANESKLAATDQLGAIMMATTIPAFAASLNFVDSDAMALEIDKLGFSLAAFHADNGHYPAKLEELVTKYADTIPDDYFSGKPLIYKPTGDGYLLYSVGANGKDDGGLVDPATATGADDESDDIGLRIGLPKPTSK